MNRQENTPGFDRAAAEDESRQVEADILGDANPPAWVRPTISWVRRVPPSNGCAEMTLLGALMANNLAATRMGTFLRAEHFADPVHRTIFTAIMRRIGAGHMADVITLRAEFEHSGALDEVGGSTYLQQILTSPPGIIDVHSYATAISDAWLRRQVIDLSETAAISGQRAREQAFGGVDPNYAPDGREIAGWLIARLQETIVRLEACVARSVEGASDHA